MNFVLPDHLRETKSQLGGRHRTRQGDHHLPAFPEMLLVTLRRVDERGGVEMAIVEIYLNSGSGFNKVGDVPHGLSRSIAIADLNGDGKTDIARAMTSSGSGASVFVALGDGAGGLVQPQNIVTGFPAYSVVSTDFDANGKADLAVADSSSANVYVLLNACGMNRKRWRGAAGLLLPTL